jgi:hypothetical protein
VNLFGFTLRDVIFEWGENFMQVILGAVFEELAEALCKKYHTMQNDEHVRMMLKELKKNLLNMWRFSMSKF